MVLAADSALRLDAQFVDFLLIALYFVFVLGISIIGSSCRLDQLGLLPFGSVAPRLGDRAGLHRGQPRCRRDHRHVRERRELRHPHQGALLLGRRRPRDAVPRRRDDDALLLRLQGAVAVAEYMRRRFRDQGPPGQRDQLAVAQLLIAGINLYLLASIVEVLLGWRLWLSLLVAAAIVLTYTALGGLSAAIYNEVLQFFVIVAALLPLTLIGLHNVGWWSGLKDKLLTLPDGADRVSSWPATNLTGIEGDAVLSVIGIVFSTSSCSPSGTGRRIRRGPAGDGVELHLGLPAVPDHRNVPEDVHPVPGDLPGHDRVGHHRRGRAQR